MNNILEQTETGREIARRLADHDRNANIARIITGTPLDDLRA